MVIIAAIICVIIAILEDVWNGKFGNSFIGIIYYLIVTIFFSVLYKKMK